VPRALARKWIEGQQLVLIFDGLDEVPEDEREPCVQARTRFLAEVGAPGVAIAGRLAEYSALATRVRLFSAIRLQPLDDDQGDAYLPRAGGLLAALRATLRTNEGLRVLSRTPLMLAIMSLVLQDLPECRFPPRNAGVRGQPTRSFATSCSRSTPRECSVSITTVWPPNLTYSVVPEAGFGEPGAQLSQCGNLGSVDAVVHWWPREAQIRAATPVGRIATALVGVREPWTAPE